jgi:hypothetical protein
VSFGKTISVNEKCDAKCFANRQVDRENYPADLCLVLYLHTLIAYQGRLEEKK